MLVWINGPFGGGKTATAHELHRRVDQSIVCEPESLGYGLHRMLPRELRTNFQDIAAWRAGVHEVLDLVLRKWEGPVIVPMTVINPGYLHQMVGRLREDGHDVLHFSLLADRETVLRRLRTRTFGLGLRHERWAVEMLACAPGCGGTGRRSRTSTASEDPTLMKADDTGCRATPDPRWSEPQS